MTKAKRCNGVGVFVELAKSLFIETIPYVDIAVRSASSKCIVNLVEANGIHWVDIFNAIFFDSVAFEGVFLFLDFRACIQVFDCNTAFNTT